MDTIFNFGDPHKDFSPIVGKILRDYSVSSIPITNNRLFYNGSLQIVDACYGFGMVWDSLSMMRKQGLLKKGSNVIFLGSMGSLIPNIALDDLVVPTEVHYIDTNKKPDIIVPDQLLLGELKTALRSSDHRFITYEHGSVRAVFDPTIDHRTYTEKRYKDSVQGIDCSESYAGLKFCEKNKLHGVVLLYCSDSPTDKIFDIPKEEFDKRALQRDLDMHHVADEILQRMRMR